MKTPRILNHVVHARFTPVPVFALALLILTCSLAVWRTQAGRGAFGGNPARAAKANAQPASPVREAIARKLQTQATVKVELFVMSQCPFGVQAEAAMAPVLAEFGGQVEFQLRFIAAPASDRFDSLHGQPEIDEDIRQTVMAAQFPAQYFDYVVARAANYRSSEWQPVAAAAGIEVETVERLTRSAAAKRLFAENIRRANELHISASPTILLDGEKYSGKVLPARSSIAACDANNAVANPALACTVNSDCNDNNGCTTDTCVSGTCQNTPIICDDNNPNTADTCNPQSGCIYDPNGCTANPFVWVKTDSGSGSLRQAILDACAGSTIMFANNVTGTITLSGGRIVIDKNLTIMGPGANLLTVQNTAAPSATSRVFNVNSGVTATISGLTISGGNLSSGNGGGILNGGTLNVTNSTISNNSAPGGFGGGIYNAAGTVNVTNSTISNNSATGGGGINNFTGGTLTVTNSTISNNSIMGGGGSGGIANFSTLTVTNSTIANNSAGTAGGGINNFGTVNSRNTIIAGNTAGLGPDFLGTLTSQGYNLIGNTTNTTISGGSNDILNMNPMLGPLQNNGGPTQTMRPLPGSPAINAGNNCVLTANGCGNNNPALTTDQRGFNRQVGGTVDSGAVETNYTLAATSGTPQSTTVNTQFTTPLLATLTESGQPVSGVQLTFSAPGSGASATLNGTNPATTNSSGQASVTATANATSGSYTVTANTTPGLATAASFSLSNICPAITAQVSGGGTICPTGTAQVTVTVSGGAGPYTVALNNNGGTQTGNGPTFTFNVSPANTTTYALASGTGANSCAITGSGSATVTVSAAPATLYVNAAVVGGAGDGSSWTDAYPTLTAALARANATGCASVTQIWVAQGTYKPAGMNGDRNATFALRSGLAIYGGFTSGQSNLTDRNPNPATNGTRLSGDLNGDDGANFANNGENSYLVVTGGGTNNTALLDGFTISGGNANCTCFPQDSGGGMFNQSSSPTLTNVSFSGNSASSQGGGMFNFSSSPTLTNVTFSANSATRGGGMYNNFSSPTLTNVTFSANSASREGGGMYNASGSPTLTNVTFSGNSAINNGGGGMYNVSSSSPKIRNSILWGDSGREIFNFSNDTPTVSDSVVQGGYANGTNIITTDPKLAPLGNYGGFTQTMRLLPGSSAIDAGNNCVLTANGCGGTHPAVTTDQRGVARPQNSTVDIGAVEVNYALAATSGSGQSALVNTAFTNSLIATLTESGQLVSGVQLTFTAPGSGASASFTSTNPATTDSNGQASVTATANATPGSYNVTANTTPGLATPASFSLMNNCATITATVSGGGTICPTGTAQVTVTVSGGAGPYTVALTNGGGTQTGNGPTFTFNVSPTSTTSYALAASTDANGCALTGQGSALVTVNAATVINTPPAAVTACPGGSASFSVAATGTGLSYQWRKGSVAISGATGSSFTLNALTAGDAGSYDVVVTGACGTLTSNAATLTVNAATAINTQPASLTRNVGQSASFAVAASGVNLTYQWRKNGNAISGATASTYTIAAVAAGDVGNYDVVVTGACGTATSNVAALTVNSPCATPVVSISGPASGAIYAAGTTVNFSGAFTDATSATTHSATWMFDNLAQAGVVNETAGTVSASYSFAQAGVYQVSLTVSNACGQQGSASTVASTLGGLAAMVVVYDPTAGFVTGGGWITSPAGAYVPNPALTGRASFGFVSKYQKGASVPTGETEFQFALANLRFKSTVYEWLVIAGARAQYRGAGTINNAGDYRFMLTAIDGQVNGGGGQDKFRIKIWNNAGGGLVYDNQMNAPDSADPTTVLGGGQIVIHSGGNGNGPLAQTGAVALAMQGDYDGDGKADPALWSASSGRWSIAQSSDQQTLTPSWGTKGDVPLLGDYDGDGKTDLAVFRPSDGTWYVKRSSDGAPLVKAWGLATDVPVPGDYDGDGKTDIAVWRGAEGHWYIVRSSDGMIDSVAWGASYAPYFDVPVPGDYDGDGKTDLAVFRRATGVWWIKRSSDGQISSKLWGLGTDVPVAADYDGDGKTDIAVWRGAEGAWYIWQSATNDYRASTWGSANDPYRDQAVPGDYDGDGLADVAVWRASDQVWYIKCSANGAVMTKPQGLVSDKPIRP